MFIIDFFKKLFVKKVEARIDDNCFYSKHGDVVCLDGVCINGVLRLLFIDKSGEEEFLYIFGGPYMSIAMLYGQLPTVKLAKELDYPCGIDLPIRDFSVPRIEDFVDAVEQAYGRLVEVGGLACGCYGGYGRTGLFIAGLVIRNQKGEIDNPAAVAEAVIYHVREQYCSHAIETKEQEKFLVLYAQRLAIS